MVLDGSGLTTTGVPNSGTAQASTSGTAITFTGIPSGVKRITVMFSGVALSGSANLLIQFGVSGTPVTSGYIAGQAYALNNGSVVGGLNSTSGFPIQYGVNTYSLQGSIAFTLLNASTNAWTGSGTFYNPNTAPYTGMTAGTVTLSGTPNQIRVYTTNGTDTFTAGSINILYE